MYIELIVILNERKNVKHIHSIKNPCKILCRYWNFTFAKLFKLYKYKKIRIYANKGNLSNQITRGSKYLGGSENKRFGFPHSPQAALIGSGSRGAP